jgi:transposase-like protein
MGKYGSDLHAMKKAADAHGVKRMDVNYWVKKWTTDGSAANFQAAARVLEAAAEKQHKREKKEGERESSWATEGW